MVEKLPVNTVEYGIKTDILLPVFSATKLTTSPVLYIQSDSSSSIPD